MASDGIVSPIYELRNYTINPKDFNTAVELVNEHHETRTKHSNLFGFWTCDIGDQVTQFVHIWEYESMSHRRRMSIAKEEEKDSAWKDMLLQPLLPCIQKGESALLAKSPGSCLNVDFQTDSSAVYLMDQAEIRCLNEPPKLNVNTEGTEILVGRFCALFGQSKTEYRLWRYTDIDEATISAKRRAIENPFDGITTLMLPTEFSPLK